MHRRTPLLALGALLVVTGCGLKGPLYLPDDQKAEPVAAPAESGKKRTNRATTPAPQVQKEDAARAEQTPPASATDADRPSPPPTVPPRS